jgi:hypothetical protein
MDMVTGGAICQQAFKVVSEQKQNLETMQMLDDGRIAKVDKEIAKEVYSNRI